MLQDQEEKTGIGHNLASMPSPQCSSELELGGGQAQTATALEHNPDNPRTWATRKRVLVCLGPIVVAFVGNLSISIYVGSITGVMQEFDVDLTAAISLVSISAAAFFLAPIIGVSVSEIYGRRIVFMISIPVALAFIIVAATAHNFTTLAVARFFASLAIAPSVTVAIGQINDVWDVRVEKVGSLIVALYAAMQVWATEVGPLTGPAIVNRTNNWRWTFWLTAILLGFSAVIMLNPETYGPVLLRRHEVRLRGATQQPRASVLSLFRIAIGRALHMLIVEPIVLPTALMAAVYQAILYCFYVAFPLLFQRVYSFTPYQTGLAFLPLLVGSILGLVVIAVIDKVLYQKTVAEAQRTGRPVPPEGRLYAAILGGILMPVGLFWLAWTAKPKFHWSVPLLSSLVVGMAFIFIMLCLPVYKNDVYGPKLGASALAADNIARYLFSVAVPLFTVQMIDRIGFQWTGSLLGFISLVLMPVPWVIFRFGPALRARSIYIKHMSSDN